MTLRNRLLMTLISLAVLAVLGGCGGGGSGSGSDVAAVSADRGSRISEERPPHPSHLDVASPAQEARRVEEARSASRARTQPQRKKHGQQPQPQESQPPQPQPAPSPGPSSSAPPAAASGALPPASAGTNGSFKPPASGEYKKITPQTIGRLEEEGAAGLAVLLNGIALAPPSAPEPIKAAISGANEIVGRPYVWGGGHQSWYSAGYDCSGAVSYALGAAGLLSAPLDSTRLESWGDPGPGRWLTVYANAGHAYAVIAGLRFDTVGDARGTGPRWHAEGPYPQGFVARHPPGY
jgi:cell wall-associated NlpC family hydrolase